MRVIGQYFHISDESLWQFMLQVIAGCRSRGSSWAAAVIVDGFCASKPWEMLLTREFNQHISQCGMCIPIAFCYITIVVVVWPAVGLCIPAKTFLSMRFVVINY